MILLIAAAILVLVPLSFSMEEEKGYICFETIDSNKDDKVTFEELVKYLGDDRERFSSVEQNEDGELAHEEYHESLSHGVSGQGQ